MANAEHLYKLEEAIWEKGIQSWNQWREENPDIAPDLRGAILSTFDLSRANLSKAKFGGANLAGSILIKANLSECDFSGSHSAMSVPMKDDSVRGVAADLHDANLYKANLCKADLSDVDLSEANLSNANLNKATLNKADLWQANLQQADLSEAKLHDANFLDANLSKANLHKASATDTDFSGSDLEQVNLQEANALGANFGGANLSQANLAKARLLWANLSGANLEEARLQGADLSAARVLGTNFAKATLTSVCIEDWSINSATNLQGIICDYVYLKENHQERRPSYGNFKPDEFATLSQQTLDTVDLIFKDGIDWQAFFQSFQELRSQYADQYLSIQAIERKQGGAFVVRLEVSEGTDKSVIESSAKELYETKLLLMEQRYRAELQAKDGEIVAYREQSANLMKITEMLAARPPMSEGNKYDLRGAQFGGGYVAGNVEGNQYGGIINNYGAKLDDINRLITSLRELAQSFPAEQKDDVLMELDDIEADVQKPQPDQKRIGRRLKRLAAIATTAAAITGGAATFSGDLNDFAGNVIELTETLGIPVEQVQHNQIPPANLP